ncbi:hypothetical protein PRUPE_1G135800 [Prunus persica]|uniref:Uncharacterized protein n=1 Tax=Prunus persica TaxID=3760 RepID=A0A251QXU6_PRUPE|nr:hypothetical protein PRUPE_1G135800 [Prunus persica]
MYVCMYKPNQFCSLLVGVTDSQVQPLPLSLITIPHRLNQRGIDENGRIKVETRHEYKHTFLGLLAKIKSSVVSVLISLISDTWANGSHDIKLISLGGGSTIIACYWGSQVSPKRCNIA